MALSPNEVAEIIQDERSAQLLDTTAQKSILAQAVTVVPMTKREMGLPVVNLLPQAGFVSYDPNNRTKPNSNLGFGKKKLYAAEIAVTITVPEEDLADADDVLLDTIIAKGSQAIAEKLDKAILFGDDPLLYPDEWSPSLFDAAVANGAGFVHQVGTGKDDLIGSILQAAGALANAGFDPEAALAAGTLKWRLANERDGNNAPIYVPSFNQGVGADGTLAGIPNYFLGTRRFDGAKAEALIIDPSAVLLGVRQDITVSISDSAVVQNVSMFETDRVAFRFVGRFGFLTADSNGKAPVAVVTPAPAV